MIYFKSPFLLKRRKHKGLRLNFFPCVVLSLTVWSLILSAPQAVAKGDWQTFTLKAPKVKVGDGDTFMVDINGNGRFDLPGERIRMLYVDTPELHKSHKGKDRKHGIPARDFLFKAITGRTWKGGGKKMPAQRGEDLRLRVEKNNRQGKYGRTLALVLVGDKNVNLALIQAGHSPLDARYSIPENFSAYARAEAQAFESGKGIWKRPGSKKRYLKRLKKEGRTPQSGKNSFYVGELPASANLSRFTGKYVQLQGKIKKIRILRRKHFLIFLGERKTTRVFALNFRAARLGLTGWKTGQIVKVAGFVGKYKGKTELKLNYGKILP